MLNIPLNQIDIHGGWVGCTSEENNTKKKDYKRHDVRTKR